MLPTFVDNSVFATLSLTSALDAEAQVLALVSSIS
jgi:hypothetical protein